MDGAPLSKRHGSASLHDFRERGFLPQALRNHLARLGASWEGEGWLSDELLQTKFDINRLGRAAARFDETQLLHWQKEAVHRLGPQDVIAWIRSRLPARLPEDKIAQFAEVVRRNITLPADVDAWIPVAFDAVPPISSDARVTIRDAGERFFAAALESDYGDLKAMARTVTERTGRKGPALYMPLRAALTGALHGPELAPLLKMLSKEQVTARLLAASRDASIAATN
jgi:glutamyl-tRNA synthetase